MKLRDTHSPPTSQTEIYGCPSSFILHPSSFILLLHPPPSSFSFILHPPPSSSFPRDSLGVQEFSPIALPLHRLKSMGVLHPSSSSFILLPQGFLGCPRIPPRIPLQGFPIAFGIVVGARRCWGILRLKTGKYRHRVYLICSPEVSGFGESALGSFRRLPCDLDF
jgi:hypothetical protein